MVKSNLSFSKHGSDLFDKILLTVFLLLVFRIGSFIPIPCINSQALLEISSRNQSGILGMLNMLSGGSLGRMSIFALAIMPYITASIVMQLLSIAFKPLEDLKKEGESGRKKINQMVRYLTIVLAAFESYVSAVKLEDLSSSFGSVVVVSGVFFKISTVLTLIVGTVLLMWIGEQISSKGIGNGSSMIIFVGIISGLPGSLINMFELSRTGVISYFHVIGISLIIFAIIAFVIFCEKSYRKVLVQTPQQKAQNASSKSSYIPIKINICGVLPPMFASSVLFFPATIAGLYAGSGKISDWFFYNFSRGKPLFFVFYTFLIFFFSFFYSSIVFNSEEIANNLKKSGSFIPGKRPGAATIEYFDYLITRITILGGLYLSFVCMLPEMLMTQISSFTLSGASLLICVSVVMDTLSQIQSYSINRQYDALVNKIKFR